MKKSSKEVAFKKIKEDVINLSESPLYKYRIENDYHPVIGEGSLNSQIMFIGEAPGKNEALKARPFCGASGRILDQLLDSINLDRESVYITNVVKDRPPENRDPKPAEIELYRPFLIRQINIIKPRVVATLGRFGMEFMLQNFNNNLEKISKGKNTGKTKLPKISQAHGNVYKLKTKEGTDFTLMPLYHPAVALYNPNSKKDLLADFEKLTEFIDEK